LRRAAWILILLAALSPLAAQSFREKVAVEFVRIEVLATDRQGRPIRDLRPEEIRLSVDGHPAGIEGLEAPPSAETPSLPRLPRSPGGPSRLTGVSAEPGVEAPSVRPSYLMAFLVDETSSDQSNRNVVYTEVFHFLEGGLPSDVQAQLMRFDGRLHVECPWTSDLERLRRSAAAMARRPAAARLGSPGALSGNPERGAFNMQLEAMEAMVHVRTSLAGMFDALRNFPDTGGRKALYFVSDGAPFLAPSEVVRDLVASSTSSQDQDDPASRSRAAIEAERDKDLLFDSVAWDRARSASLLTEVARLALVRGIEIHPLRAAAHDLSGRVRTDRAFSARANARSATPNDPRSRALRDSATIPTTDIAAGQSMEAVAETTGGEAILSRRFLGDGLKEEVESRDAAHIVSFRDPFAGDHRFHRIEISSTRPGAKLRYRRGYRVLDIRESLLEGAANRLYLRADANPLGARLQLDSLGVESGRARARITVVYPAPPRAGGSAGEEGVVKIVGFCAVRDGALRQLDFSGQAEAIPSDGGPWLTRSGAIALQPGAYRWSFAIRDEQTGITSYLTFDRALP